VIYLFYGIRYPIVTPFFSFPIYYAPEFTAKAVRKWLANLGVKTLYIEPGSPWENGYVESFIGKLRDVVAEWRDL
jgi:transposase InsO family protein